MTMPPPKDACDALADMIAALGYPVGCGIPPHPDTVQFMVKAVAALVAPQPPIPLAAIREVLRISDRAHPAWDEVNAWLTGAPQSATAADLMVRMHAAEALRWLKLLLRDGRQISSSSYDAAITVGAAKWLEAHAGSPGASTATLSGLDESDKAKGEAAAGAARSTESIGGGGLGGQPPHPTPTKDFKMDEFTQMLQEAGIGSTVMTDGTAVYRATEAQLRDFAMRVQNNTLDEGAKVLLSLKSDA